MKRHISCDGKRKYESFAIANKLAKRQRRQRDGDHVGAYHCVGCKFFHIGTNHDHGTLDKRKVAVE